MISLVLLLAAAPAVAPPVPGFAPSPSPSPTPVAKAGSLSDVAKNRKLAAKTFTVEPSKATPTPEASEEKPGKSSDKPSKSSPSLELSDLRATVTSFEEPTSKGTVWIDGEVRNEGGPSACSVRIRLAVLDGRGTERGATTTTVAGPVATGARDTFRASVRADRIGPSKGEVARIQESHPSYHPDRKNLLDEIRATVVAGRPCD